MKLLLRYQRWLPLLFFGVLQLFYAGTYRSGFVTDFTGLMARFDGQNAWGILSCFGFPALEQVLNAFLYVFYRLFDLRPLPWYVAFTAWHSLNTYLVYRLSENLLQAFALKTSRWIPIAGALLFLLSPYQSEVVVWRVCFNFLLVTSLMVGSLLVAAHWLESDRQQRPWGVYGLFIVALFTFELSLVLPFLLMSLAYFHPSGPRRAAWLWVPPLLSLGGYFLLNKWLLGVWVGHYGAETHLRFSISEITAHGLSYTAKLLALVRYWPYPEREWLFLGLRQTWVLVLIGGGLFLILLLSTAFRKRLKPKYQLLTLFALWFGLALGPIINLYFDYLLFIQHDRYTYLAAAFFYPGLVLLVSGIPRKWFWPVFVAYLLLHLIMLVRTNRYWQESSVIYWRLIDSFDQYPAAEVWLLNVPDNLQGAPLFRDYGDQPQGVADALQYLRRKPYTGTLREVAQYNLATVIDYVAAEWQENGSLEVSFQQWGNWWWRSGRGLTNYETPAYEVQNQGHHYLLKPKQSIAEVVLLIQKEGAWQRIPITPPKPTGK